MGNCCEICSNREKSKRNNKQDINPSISQNNSKDKKENNFINIENLNNKKENNNLQSKSDSKDKKEIIFLHIQVQKQKKTIILPLFNFVQKIN